MMKWIFTGALAIALTVTGCGDDDPATVAPTPDGGATAGADATAEGDEGESTTGTDTTGPGPDNCTPSCDGKACGSDGCGGSCGVCADATIAVTVTYDGEAKLEGLRAYLLIDKKCIFNPKDDGALLTSDLITSVGGTMVLEPIPDDKPHTVIVIGFAPGGGPRVYGCTDTVVAADKLTQVNVTLVDLPIAFEGVYDLDTKFNLEGVLPPTVAKLVDNLAEMTDDNDLFNANPSDDQYGQDPAAFLLDFLYRQLCCWEAEPGNDYDACKDQATTHKFGDLEAIYTHDFTQWEGAAPRSDGLCGGVGIANDLLQDTVNQIIEEQAPGIGNLLVNIPKDLTQAIEKMNILSKMTITIAAVVAEGQFVHELTGVRVILHDLEGAPQTLELTLDGAGFVALSQSGTATTNGDVLSIPQHAFQLDTGKLLLHIYNKGLLPMLGFDDTMAMLGSFVDCKSLAEKVEDEVPDFGLLDAEDYEGYCGDGLEAAAEYIEESIEELVKASTTITVVGQCRAGDLNAASTAITLVEGEWQATWTEGDAMGSFPGTFTGKKQ